MLTPDIVHILNPPPPAMPRQRRRHSYNVPQASRTSSTLHRRPSRRSRASTIASTPDNAAASVDPFGTAAPPEPLLANPDPRPSHPQVWIRVPEPDLTTVWTALSGFEAMLDTGNYGVIAAGIRVVRASRYLTTNGPLRSKW